MSDRPKPGEGEAVVSFSTKLPGKYQVPEDDLVVPADLGRYGLSEIVNRMLDFDAPVPFDFLVDGEFLRSSVLEYLVANKRSSEKVLKLEYVVALSEPEKKDIDQVPDWISGVAALQAPPSAWFVAVSYDGTARVYEGERSQSVVRLADTSVTAVAAISVDNGRGSHIVAAGKDGTMRCCALRHTGGAAAAGPVVALRSSASAKAVEAVAINEDGTLLASGGWDQDICVWNGNVFEAPSADGSGSNKRKAPEEVSPKFALEGGHNQTVTCLQFGQKSRHPFTLISGSWDCTLRVWDIAAASCVCNFPVGRAVTSVSISPGMPSQMATSHEDGHVSIWDVRAAPHATIQGALALDSAAGLPLASAQALHRRLASQVVWCPEDAFRIASVGHDGQLCILDPRSPKMPLQTLRAGGGSTRSPVKLLCASWLGRDEIAAGGSDGKVLRVRVGNSALPDDDA